MIFTYVIEDMEGVIRDQFDYEVEDMDLRNAYWEILLRYDKEELIDFLVNEYTIDDFYDELKEYFEEGAMECHRESR